MVRITVRVRATVRFGVRARVRVGDGDDQRAARGGELLAQRLEGRYREI